MSELPGMWDESDLRGGEADCAENLLIVRKLKEENAALKEENERLKAEKVQINGKLAGSRLAVSRLKARVAELTAPDVQGEPVAALIVDEDATSANYRVTGFRVDALSCVPLGEHDLFLAPPVVKNSLTTHPAAQASPRPAEQHTLKSSLALDAATHLTNWLDMDLCECEGGHTCGYNEVQRTRDALLAVAEQQPDAALQGEPVAALLIGEPEYTKQGWEPGDWDIAPNATAIEAFARLAGPGAYQLYLAPQPGIPETLTQEQQPAPHTDDDAVDRFAVAMKDKLAASREKGRHGWQNATAPHLSALLYDHLYKADPLDVGNLAMMLHQNGQAIELMPQPAPDVAGLVDALELVMHCNEVGFLPEIVQQAVSDALAAHRKGAQP